MKLLLFLIIIVSCTQVKMSSTICKIGGITGGQLVHIIDNCVQLLNLLKCIIVLPIMNLDDCCFGISALPPCVKVNQIKVFMCFYNMFGNCSCNYCFYKVLFYFGSCLVSLSFLHLIYNFLCYPKEKTEAPLNQTLF